MIVLVRLNNRRNATGAYLLLVEARLVKILMRLSGSI
jgi:hypothetical protein